MLTNKNNVYHAFRQPSSSERSLDTFMDDRFRRYFDADGEFRPALNTSKSEQGYELQIAMPGLSKKDIEISVEDDVLTITGKNPLIEDREGQTFIRREFKNSPFSMNIQLPDNVDESEIKARHKDGVLTIRIPNVEQVTETEISRRVEVH